MFCKYKNIFGEAKKGVHRFRIFNIAIVDVIATIFVAYLIYLAFPKFNYFCILFLLFYIRYNFTSFYFVLELPSINYYFHKYYN